MFALPVVESRQRCHVIDMDVTNNEEVKYGVVWAYQ